MPKNSVPAKHSVEASQTSPGPVGGPGGKPAWRPSIIGNVMAQQPSPELSASAVKNVGKKPNTSRSS